MEPEGAFHSWGGGGTGRRPVEPGQLSTGIERAAIAGKWHALSSA
jgi:hypothetical protein